MIDLLTFFAGPFSPTLTQTATTLAMVVLIPATIVAVVIRLAKKSRGLTIAIVILLILNLVNFVVADKYAYTGPGQPGYESNR